MILDQIPERLIGLVVDLNYEIKAKDSSFDYKKDLKSPNAIRALASELIQSYEKDFMKGRAKGFGQSFG